MCFTLKGVFFMAWDGIDNFNYGNIHVPANHPDFIGRVLTFDFQNLQKSGRPDFLEFQLVIYIISCF